MFKKTAHIHFVGIGGSGMSGIAEVLINLGYVVSGSDAAISEITKRLKNLGARFFLGHDASNIKGADVVVCSSAIALDNVEVTEAIANGIPVIPRAEMLAELMRLKYGIAVAGSHGKTTTTSMISLILSKGGLDPTVVVGGRFNDIGSNAKLGNSEYMVVETDESDGSFLRLSPIIAVVTNIDMEHLDYYKDLEDIQNAFVHFMNKVPFYGRVILCLDSIPVCQIKNKVHRQITTYGLNKESDVRAEHIVLKGFYSEYNLIYHGRNLGRINLNIPGLHYVNNSLAAIAVGLELGVRFETIVEALSEYSGVQRRFQIKGDVNRVLVMDDYAHHPSEIKCTLEALRIERENKRIITIFQPHRYSRTKSLAQEFGNVFNQAQIVVVTDIYPAGEKPINGVSASLIVENLIKSGHPQVMYIHQFEDIVNFLVNTLQQDDLVITLGAGNVWKIGEMLIQKLKDIKNEDF